MVVENALLSAAVAKLRDSRTDAEGFRSALSAISTVVILEAGRHEPIIEAQIMTPVSPVIGVELTNPPLLVPILRAGLGMLYAGLSLMPNGDSWIRWTISRRENLDSFLLYDVAPGFNRRPVRIYSGSDARHGWLRSVYGSLACRARCFPCNDCLCDSLP